mmetsp:Transcript_28353/g.91432  ORF Transcript_28353/g.91432 Transcript_28353/m.91432 type:complete len:222 (-) Transcript_28353:310-975(-)
MVPVGAVGVAGLDRRRDFPDPQVLLDDVVVALGVAALASGVDGVVRDEAILTDLPREETTDVAVVLRRRPEPELRAHRRPLRQRHGPRRQLRELLLAQPLAGVAQLRRLQIPFRLCPLFEFFEFPAFALFPFRRQRRIRRLRWQRQRRRRRCRPQQRGRLLLLRRRQQLPLLPKRDCRRRWGRRQKRLRRRRQSLLRRRLHVRRVRVLGAHDTQLVLLLLL